MSSCFICGSPRCLLLALLVGGVISLCLQVITLQFTSRQMVYADVMNHAGRLRLLTERYGSDIFFEKWLEVGIRKETKALTNFLDTRNSSDTMSKLLYTCDQLVGDPIQHHGGPSVPMIPDDDVRNQLALWRGRLGVLKESAFMDKGIQAGQWAIIIHFRRSISTLIEELEVIVERLRDRSQAKLQHINILQLLRFVFQASFHFWIFLVFRCVWVPFVKAFSDAQCLQRQQHSLLRADFDAVIEINTSYPFRVQRSCLAADDMSGKPMHGESVLEVAANEGTRQAFQCFLNAGLLPSAQEGKHLKRRPWFLRRIFGCSYLGENLWWPKMAVTTELDNTTFAPKIHSTWGGCDVEVFLVGRDLQNENSALLAVRQLGVLTDRGASALGAHASMDFHSWSRALQSKRAEANSAVAHAIRGINDDTPRSVGQAKEKISIRTIGSCSIVSSSILSFDSKIFNKMNLGGMDHIKMTLVDGTGIQSYEMCFAESTYEDDNEGHIRARPDLSHCFLERNGFMKWMQESSNAIINEPEVDHFTFEDQVVFRPPTATCASPKVLFCAETARILRCECQYEDVTWALHLFGVSQLVKSCHRTAPASSRLPTLEEHEGSEQIPVTLSL